MKMASEDITKQPHVMRCLQEDLPVVFEVIRSIHSYPHELVGPIAEELLLKASAPFQEDDIKPNEEFTPTTDEMSVFPHLPKCREQRAYAADSAGEVLTCTNKTSHHPTLLPGVFTIFCEHGKTTGYETNLAHEQDLEFITDAYKCMNAFVGICYGFQVLRVCESPNIPFTILFERFSEGILHMVSHLQTNYESL